MITECNHTSALLCVECRQHNQLTELGTANADLAKRLEEAKQELDTHRVMKKTVQGFVSEVLGREYKCHVVDAGITIKHAHKKERQASNDRITELEAKLKLFAWLEDETLDLRCISYPTGGDDYDVGWVVIEHHQADPQEREIGCGATPAEAIKQALKRGE